MINRRSYVKKLFKGQKNLAKKLRAYLTDQNEKNVHDLRTASRRVLGGIRLLPHDIRDKKTNRKYVSTIEKLISINAKVRDLDLVLSRLAANDLTQERIELSSRIRNSRKALLKPAVRFASTMKAGPSLTLHSSDLSNIFLRRRFNKIARNLQSKIEERLPVVLQDPREKDELHRLREDSRQLRYTLELAGTPKTDETLAVLKSWQDILGQVHDSDIIIDFLQHQEKSPETHDLLRDEITIRNTGYEKFATMAAANKPAFKSSH